jgi:hypothetical protein
MFTDWGTWIENALYLFAHFDDLMTFIDGLGPNKNIQDSHTTNPR